MAPLSRAFPRPASHTTFPSVLSVLLAALILALRLPAASAATKEQVLADESRGGSRGWALGEQVAVECLNRTIETGEHITDEAGELQYIPFWKCNETGRGLELGFGSEQGTYASELGEGARAVRCFVRKSEEERGRDAVG